MRGVLDGEWGVYAGAALETFGRARAEHEGALHAHGRSAMFNSRVGEGGEGEGRGLCG